MAPTGVTVVTGFLGAGKTTLVNYVLNADHGYRVAVILNDFGAQLGVEKMLVQDKPDGDNAVEEWVELNNGCVCCTVKGTLVQTIDNLLEKRASTGRKFDFILLETTGLADPGPVAQELWVDDEILEDDGAVLDAVVTLVDASNIERQLSEGKEASLQIAYADTVVLNKCDLVDDEKVPSLRNKLAAQLRDGTKIVRAAHAQLDPTVLLGLAAASENDLDNRPSHHDDVDGEHDHDDFESFVVDLGLGFVTGYRRGAEVVMDLRLIALNYLRGWFWVDFISCIPVDQLVAFYEGVAEGSGFRTLKLLRVVRLVRLVKLARITKLSRFIRFLEDVIEIPLIRLLSGLGKYVSRIRVGRNFLYRILFDRFYSCIHRFTPDFSNSFWS